MSRLVLAHARPCARHTGATARRFSQQTRQSRWDGSESPYRLPQPSVMMIAGGLVGIGTLHLWRQQSSDSAKHSSIAAGDPDMQVEGSWTLRAYAALPLRELSRAWGSLNSVTVPSFLRSPLYSLYSSIFNCNLDEMASGSLAEFSNLGEFFYRSLKPNARPIDFSADLVCPSDGKVLCVGRVDETERRVPLVKGLSYSLDALLGKESHVSLDNGAAVDPRLNADAHNPVKKGNGLHFCVIYLAPGDYHKFHSPADWTVHARRHFAGELLSVAPWIAAKIRNLFIINERVSLAGTWKHGFFSMIPVGATNVGSIVIDFDSELKTNTPDVPSATFPIGTFRERAMNVALEKGDPVGGFRLGSTVVLVFEAPEDFKFVVKDGDVVKMGTRLGK
ncbi:hypothetical protein HDU84_009178 [Entophlyctis sp. JEL0112]|nr:hypothetical protein HDU84_009178 [Entophlyctis sp. JEL0112]